MATIAPIASLVLDISANTAALTRSVDNTNATLGRLETGAAKVGKIMAGAFTATAVIAAGKAVLDFADNLTNLSAKTGISTTGLQKLDLAFQQSGISLDTVTTASGKLAKALIGEDKSAVGALTKLGLSVDVLKRMKPEDQFIAVADAVGKIQNPTEKTYAAMTIFGKGGVELLAGLNGKLKETTAEFERMGLIVDEETIAAADQFGDQLGLLGRQLLGVTAQIVGPLLPALSALANLIGKIGRVIGDVIGFFVEWIQKGLVAAYAAIVRFVAGAAELATKIPFLGKHLGFAGDAAAYLRKQAEGADQYLVKLFTSTTDITNGASLAAPAMIGLGKATEDAGKAAKKAREEYQEWLARVNQPIFDAIARRDQLNVDQMFQIRELTKLQTPTGFRPLGVFDAMAAELRELQTTILPGFIGFGKAVVQAIAPPPTFLQSAIKNSFGALPQIIMSALTGGGDIGRSVGGLFGGQLFGALGKKLIGDGASGLGGFLAGNLGGMLSKTLGGAIGSVIPGIGTMIGSMIGPLLGKIGGFFKGLFGGPSQKELEGRAAEKQFVESLRASLTATQRLESAMLVAQGQSRDWADSVIAIRDAYLATGRTAEQALRDRQRLYEAEKRGAEAVKRVMDDINEAFIEQRADAERLDAAIKKYGFSIEELGPKLRAQQLNDQAKDLIEDWRVLVASGIDVAIVNDKMAQAMSDYVNAAVRSGVEIPNAMKPILQSLVDQGKLRRELSADENTALEGAKRRIGEIETLLQQAQSAEQTELLNHELNKQKNIVDSLSKTSFTNLEDAGIRFSETMTEGFDRVVQKLDELIRRLQGAGVEIDSLPTDLTVDVQFRAHAEEVDRYIEGLRERLPGGWFDGLIDKRRDSLLNSDSAIPMANGGIGMVNRPTLFLAGEAGPEQFAFSGAGRSFGGGENSQALAAVRDEVSSLRDELRSELRMMTDRVVSGFGEKLSTTRVRTA